MPGYVPNGGGGGSPSPLTQKGDLYTYDTGDARLAVGADGTTLIALASETAGHKWQGKLLSSTANSADQTVATPNVITVVTGLTHSITAPYTGDYLLSYRIIVYSANARSDTVMFRVGAGAWQDGELETVPAGYTSNLCGIAVVSLTAGATTVDIGHAHDSAAGSIIYGGAVVQTVAFKSRSILWIP